MQITPWALAAATPAIAGTVRAVATVAHRAQEAFADALSAGPAEAGRGEAAPGTDESPQAELRSLAERLRTWLGQQGITSPFEVNLTLDATGAEQLDVAGLDADSIEQRLGSESEWRQAFRQAASNLQAMLGGLASGGVHVRVTEADSQFDLR